MRINWQINPINHFSAAQFLQLLTLRQDIFLIEQESLYRDLDDLDERAWHVTGENSGGIVAYARIIPPQVISENVTLGRLVVPVKWRAQGIGRQLLEQLIVFAKANYPGCDIDLSAQTSRLTFYQKMGFVALSAPYDDGGIEHIDMRLTSSS